MHKKDAALAIIQTFGGELALNDGEFRSALCMYGEFSVAISTDLFCDGAPTLLRKLKKRVCDIVVGAERAKEDGMQVTPIFLIAPADYAVKKWFQVFRQVLEKKLPGTPIYTIVFGGYFQGSVWRDSEVKPYEGEEVCAHELGCVKLFYNPDAISSGMRRLAEFIDRIMGCDLPGDEFPNYSLEDLKKIAWNISRESFNLLSVRDGAIPKYPICGETGRPIFPF